MIRDFSSVNTDIVVMTRGTDGDHSFIPSLEDGSAFIWADYDVICDGRLASASAEKNFTFATSYEFDEFGLVDILFPKEVITTTIREQKIYWRVLATHKIKGNTILLRRGELWLI